MKLKAPAPAAAEGLKNLIAFCVAKRDRHYFALLLDFTKHPVQETILAEAGPYEALAYEYLQQHIGRYYAKKTAKEAQQCSLPSSDSRQLSLPGISGDDK